MPKVTQENLEKFFEPINAAMEKWDINMPRRMAMFLAQLAHETGGLKYMAENLNYSAEALLKVFPKYFYHPDVAKEYEHKPELIANIVYAGRMGNLNPGDGWKYRGRGGFQLTGADNYRAYFKAVGLPLDSDPALIEGPVYAMDSSGWFWSMRGLNDIADRADTFTKEWKGTLCDPFHWISVKINGGFNGIEDRLKYYANAKIAFGL